MNNALIPPPVHDLRPATRKRQRDELIAIIEHESHDRAPRRRLVPLVAAAAVLVLTAGMAVGVPALRGQSREPAVSAGAPTVEPLSEVDKTRYGRACWQKLQVGKPGVKTQADRYQVLDGIRFANAPDNTYTATWVVVNSRLMGYLSCGIDRDGKVLQAMPSGVGQPMYHLVESRMVGGGAYDKSISRITITIGTRPTVEAVLRHGFYYAPVPYVRVRGPHTDSTVIPTIVRGYDTTGELFYTSPRTDGEVRARSKACYVDPNGNLTGWRTDNPHPDLKTCRRTTVWNFAPR